MKCELHKLILFVRSTHNSSECLNSYALCLLIFAALLGQPYRSHKELNNYQLL